MNAEDKQDDLREATTAAGVEATAEGEVQAQAASPSRNALGKRARRRVAAGAVAALSVVAILLATAFLFTDGNGTYASADGVGHAFTTIYKALTGQDVDIIEEGGGSTVAGETRAGDEGKASEASDKEEGDASSAEEGKDAASDASSSSSGASVGASASSGGAAGSGGSGGSGSSSSASSASGEAAAGGSAAASSGGTSTASSSAVQQDVVTVSVGVSGSGYGDVSGGGSFTFAKGATAYDALMACGLSVNARNTAYGIYVSAIGGLAEKQHGGSSGWMYSVNGIAPNTSAGNYVLSDGDSVQWYYVA